MNEYKVMMFISGIGLILSFLIGYLWSGSPFSLFCITLGIMVLLSGFYSEGEKVKVSLSYAVTMFSVNIVQWGFLIYIFYYNLAYGIGEYYFSLIIALLSTLFIVNQIRKKYFRTSETKINILKDKTKLILLIVGLIIIIGNLVGFVVYNASIFLYGITLGAMAFIFGFYHDGKKVNISWNYALIMGFLLISQFYILFAFINQFSEGTWPFAMTISINIALFFLIQLYAK